MNEDEIIKAALSEDIGNECDHTSHACIPPGAIGEASLLVKDEGVIAGIELAYSIFSKVDPNLKLSTFKADGDHVSNGDIIFTVAGNCISILTAERLVLNFMQRMSGIATSTREYVNKVKGTGVKILDTRKTTPLLRHYEKWAVRIGGGSNHRFGLYDMILIKDNHVDFSGGIRNAIENVIQYQQNNQLNLPVEIETRSIDEVIQVLEIGNVNRIMLDNFTPSLLKEAIQLIGKKFETEASGGITLNNIGDYASSGVDYISVGALTHSSRILDLSLKAKFNA